MLSEFNTTQIPKITRTVHLLSCINCTSITKIYPQEIETGHIPGTIHTPCHPNPGPGRRVQKKGPVWRAATGSSLPCAHNSSSFLQSALSYGAVPCIYLCPLDQHRCFRMPHLAEHQRPGEARGLEYQRGHSSNLHQHPPGDAILPTQHRPASSLQTHPQATNSIAVLGWCCPKSHRQEHVCWGNIHLSTHLAEDPLCGQHASGTMAGKESGTGLQVGDEAGPQWQGWGRVAVGLARGRFWTLD